MHHAVMNRIIVAHASSHSGYRLSASLLEVHLRLPTLHITPHQVARTPQNTGTGIRLLRSESTCYARSEDNVIVIVVTSSSHYGFQSTW